jgi:hypothetical protein
MKIFVAGTLAALFTLGVAAPASAHCDSLDGPVVTAARTALESGDVTPVLKWITKAQEAEVRSAFSDAVAVRGSSARARELADKYFFETVVRLHRASEGEPYTGLQPAGTVEEHIEAADRALAGSSVDRLADVLSRQAGETLRARFAEVIEKRTHASESVEAGRAYVKAYVAFIHYAEELGALAGASPHPTATAHR